MTTLKLNAKPQQAEQLSAWELGSNIFGQYASGKDNLSTNPGINPLSTGC